MHEHGHAEVNNEINATTASRVNKTSSWSQLLRRTPRRIVQFIIVGGIGFVVDAAILTALTSWAGWDALRARGVSFLGAVTITWWLNRGYTFAARRARLARVAGEYPRYLLAQCLGAALNYAVFAAAIVLLPSLRAYPVAPLIFGSAVAMFFNYFAMQRFVFPAVAHPAE